MKNVDKILREVNVQERKIPIKIEYKIQNALKGLENQKNKNKSKHYIKKFVLSLASLTTVLVAGVSAYAAFGGTIQGIPVANWFGLKFSTEYENYKVNIEGQEVQNESTKVKLASVISENYFTILEFNVNLSKEDKTRLHIDEPVVTEKYISDNTKMPNISTNYNGKEITQEEMKEKIIKQNSGKTVDMLLLFNEELLFDNEGNPYVKSQNNSNVIIDNQEHYIKEAYQSVCQISEYEYKVYQVYFLTEKDIGEKTNFTITLNNIILTSKLVQLGEKAVFIPIEGNFEVEVSKKETLDSKSDFYVKNNEIKYKNVTKKVDKISSNSLVTTIKVTTIINNVKRLDLTEPQSENFIGHNTYKVFDSYGKELNSNDIETQRIITYSDGSKEEWTPGDIGTYKEFNNATLELTDYIFLEKSEDINSIIIQPIIEKSGENIELEKFFIDRNK